MDVVFLTYQGLFGIKQINTHTHTYTYIYMYIYTYELH